MTEYSLILYFYCCFFYIYFGLSSDSVSGSRPLNLGAHPRGRVDFIAGAPTSGEYLAFPPLPTCKSNARETKHVQWPTWDALLRPYL